MPMLEDSVEENLDNIDAAVFSGDAFTTAPAIAYLREFMARWERELKLNEQLLNENIESQGDNCCAADPDLYYSLTGKR